MIERYTNSHSHTYVWKKLRTHTVNSGKWKYGKVFHFHHFKLVVWILQCSNILFIIKILNKHLKIKHHSQISTLYLIINKHIRNGQQIEVRTLDPGALYLMTWYQWTLLLFCQISTWIWPSRHPKYL